MSFRRMGKYLELTKLDTPYARKMRHLSNRIFGEAARPSQQIRLAISNKLSRLPMYKDPDIVDYYHRLPEAHYFLQTLRAHGLYRDEHQDFKEEMTRRRNLHGVREVRVNPKKGTPEWDPYIFLRYK